MKSYDLVNWTHALVRIDRLFPADYADIGAALLGGLLLAWVADLLTGRRGFGGASLVSGVGLACGWFLAVRVFGVSTMSQWTWVLWSLAASALALGAALPALARTAADDWAGRAETLVLLGNALVLTPFDKIKALLKKAPPAEVIAS